MTALPEGTKIRYRKTRGTGIIREHTCPPERPCRGYTEPVHAYGVEFITRPYRGTTRQVWVRDDDAVPS